MPPRLGKARRPYIAFGSRAARVIGGVVKALRASSEIISPVVFFSWRASSLAAWSTSLAILRVVRMRQMLLHHASLVKHAGWVYCGRYACFVFLRRRVRCTRE